MNEAPTRDVRWMSFRNVSDPPETVPPYGLMMLDDGDMFFDGNAIHGEQSIWRLKKPDKIAWEDQDPSRLFVNGPTPVKPGGFGQCTQDWPAQVLHNGAKDSLPNGVRCGPIPDSWFVWSGGNAFTCTTHDKTWPCGQTGYHTVWITAGRPTVAGPSFAALGAGVYRRGETIGCTLDERMNQNARISDFWNAGEYGEFQARFGGYYLFGFQGCIWSDQTNENPAPQHAWLTLRLYINGAGTRWRGTRRQLIEIVDYDDDNQSEPTELARSAEMIAVTGIVQLKNDDLVCIKNDSNYDIDVGDFGFWMTRIGAPLRESSGGLHYDH